MSNGGRIAGLRNFTEDEIAEIRLRKFCGEPLVSIERTMGRCCAYYARGGKTRAERIAADPTYLARHKASKQRSYRRHDNPEARRERYRLYHRDRKIARDHQQKLQDRGITQDDFDALLERQGGLCALCGGYNSRIDRELALDHDHNTGQVRGLLCDRCNLALGWCFDDPDFLERAAIYVRGPRNE